MMLDCDYVLGSGSRGGGRGVLWKVRKLVHSDHTTLTLRTYLGPLDPDRRSTLGLFCIERKAVSYVPRVPMRSLCNTLQDERS